MAPAACTALGMTALVGHANKDVDVIVDDCEHLELKQGLEQGPVSALHPEHAPAAPSRAAFAERGPIIATGHPNVQGVQIVDGNANTSSPIALNERAVEFETDLFKGKMLMSVRGAPGVGAVSGPGGPLACKTRSFHIAVQGRFKQEVWADDLVSGQEFPKPPKTSASFMHFVFTGAAKVFANTTDVYVQEGEPMHFRFPVSAAAQVMNVARPGEEPPLLEATEDLRVWCPELTSKCGGPAPAERRRKFFDVPANLANRKMGTDLVWTLHLHQSLIDFSTYKLGLAGVPFGIDLVSLLDAQPLQIMCRNKRTGAYIFNLLMWSERLIAAADGEAPDAEPKTVSDRLKGRFKGLLSGW